MPKKPAEPETGNFWESPLEPIYHNIRKNLKGHPHANFIEIYLGLAVIIVFLLFASLAPQIGDKLGLLSQKKETQQSFAKDESSGQPKQKITPGVKAVSPQLIEKQKIRENKESPISEEKTPVKLTADLNGKVVDTESGLPASGAEVVIESPNFNSKATTDENGNYQILDIPAGEYEVGVKKEGYSGQAKPAILASGGTVSIDFSLSK